MPATIDDLEPAELADLQPGDLMYLYRATPSPKDATLTADQIARATYNWAFAKCTKTADQGPNLLNATWTKVTWDNDAVSDAYGFWDSANDQFVVPTNMSGAYIVKAGYRVNQVNQLGSINYMQIVIRHNGDILWRTVVGSGSYRAYKTNRVIGYFPTVAEGDTFHIEYYVQGDVGTSKIPGTTAYTEFSICRIGAR